MKLSAIISADGLYRYELRREWDESLPPLYLGCLNPSTADAEVEDPTSTRGVVRAKQNGFGSLVIWNVGAGRATDPKDWLRMADPIGPENDTHIQRLLGECRERGGLTCAGWGAHAPGHRQIAVRRFAREAGVSLHHLGLTKDGRPRHPLYIAYSQPFIEWGTP